MQYLGAGQEPAEVDILERVREAATFMRLDATGRLYMGAREGSTRLGERIVPPICDRGTIVQLVLEQLGYPSGERLYQVLRE